MKNKTRSVSTTCLCLLLGIASLSGGGCASTSGSKSASAPPATAGSTGHLTPYPLKTCIVSGNALDSMGDTVTEVYEGREIKFCCKPCVKKFHANPAKYMAKLK